MFIYVEKMQEECRAGTRKPSITRQGTAQATVFIQQGGYISLKPGEVCNTLKATLLNSPG